MKPDKADGPEDDHPDQLEALFEQAVQEVKQSGILGRRGRLQELFDYLAKRSRDQLPPKESELAAEVFQKSDTLATGDDPIVRVSVYRLRKLLSEFYRENRNSNIILTIPKGEYRIVASYRIKDELPLEDQEEPKKHSRNRYAIALIALAIITVPTYFLAKQYVQRETESGLQNDFWRRFRDSPRPLAIVVGDEFFNSGPTTGYAPSPAKNTSDPGEVPAGQADLREPGMSYLPLSVAYALKDIVPQLISPGKQLQLIPASQANPNTLKENNIVYIGRLENLSFLETPVFMRTRFKPSQAHDQIIDTQTKKIFASGEDTAARESKDIYEDYGYIFIEGNRDGRIIGVISGTGNMGLRGAAEITSAKDLPSGLENMAHNNKNYEALFEFKGQSYTNISNRVISVNEIKKH